MKLPVINVTAAWKWTIAAVGTVAAKGPYAIERLSSLFGGDVKLAPVWHDASLLVGICALIVTLQTNPHPPGTAGGAAGSGVATPGKDGASLPAPPVSPFRWMPLTVSAVARPAWLARLIPAALIAGFLGVLAAFGCHDPNAAGIVTTNLSPAGACVMADLLSGVVNLTDPGAAALQLLAQCAGTTVEGIISMIEQLMSANPTDGGVGASLPSSVLVQLPAVRDALLKLPKGYSHDDAVKALAAKR